MGAKLVVLNLSQQTDSGDLLGGFRPVQPAEAVLPLLDRFADLVGGLGGGASWLARCLPACCGVLLAPAAISSGAVAFPACHTALIHPF